MCDISGWAPRPLTSHYIAAMAISRALSGGRLSPAVLSGITTEVVYMLLYFRGQASSCGMRASTSLVTHGWADSTMPSGPTSQKQRKNRSSRHSFSDQAPSFCAEVHVLVHPLDPACQRRSSWERMPYTCCCWETLATTTSSIVLSAKIVNGVMSQSQLSDAAAAA